MVNLYYEADGSWYGVRGRYWVQRDVHSISNEHFETRLLYNSTALTLAERVWREEDNEVRYYKNRMEDLKETFGECDMEEFMWIKLQAKPLP